MEMRVTIEDGLYRYGFLLVWYSNFVPKAHRFFAIFDL